VTTGLPAGDELELSSDDDLRIFSPPAADQRHLRSRLQRQSASFDVPEHSGQVRAF
jgi:hypothetical protein